jgi:hypothetical protein
MENTDQSNVDYLKETEGMLKKDRITYLTNLFQQNNNDVYISFGSYNQFSKDADGNFLLEPLLWRILNTSSFKKDGYLILITKYLIDCHYFGPFNLYKTSPIRQFLNSYLYEDVFSKREKKRIIPTLIGDDLDNVFLLAKEDYLNPLFFSNNDSRKTRCTDYAIYLRGYHNKETYTGTYWTRSQDEEKSSNKVIIVNTDGSIGGGKPFHKCPGWHHSFSSMPCETVRPAIRIKM